MENGWNAFERLGVFAEQYRKRVALEVDLQPIHLDILIFLSEANHYSDQLKALVQYLGCTKGTASQSVKLLVERAWLSKAGDARDARVQHLACTPKTVDLVSKYRSDHPIYHLERSESHLVQSLGENSLELLKRVQQHQSFASYGICSTCRHHRKDHPKLGEYYCGLTQEKLPQHQISKRCLEHEMMA